MKYENHATAIFANRLSILREERGVSQKTLANAIHASRQAVAQYENGTALPAIDKLYEISKFFNVSADYLLGIDDNRTIPLIETAKRNAQIEVLDKIIEFCQAMKKNLD